MANLRVIAEIKPAGDFPVVDAPNVSVTGGKRLDVALSEAAAEVAKKANKSEVDAALAGKANKSEVDAAIENKADKSALEATNASVSANTSNIQELSTESTVLSARMDEFTKLEEGSTTGDAELIDGRVSADGKTYDNIGGAIRGQVTDLKSDLESVSDVVGSTKLNIYNRGYESFDDYPYTGSAGLYCGAYEYSDGYVKSITIKTLDTTSNGTVWIIGISGKVYKKLTNISGNGEITLPINSNMSEKFYVFTDVTAIAYKSSSQQPFYGFSASNTYKTSIDSAIEGDIVALPTFSTSGTSYYMAVRVNYGNMPDIISDVKTGIKSETGENKLVVTQKNYKLTDFTIDGNNAPWMSSYIYHAGLVKTVTINVGSSSTNGYFWFIGANTNKLLYKKLCEQIVEGQNIINVDFVVDEPFYIGCSINGIRYKQSSREPFYKSTDSIPTISSAKIGDTIEFTWKYTTSSRGYYFGIQANYGTLLELGTHSTPTNSEESFWDTYASLSMFPTFGVIGDSYASGEIFTGPTSAVDSYWCSWGQILARKNGIKCTNYSHGGMTTRYFLRSIVAEPYGIEAIERDEPKHMYMLVLGINDGDTGTTGGLTYLGTLSDITSHTSYSDYPDTFYGNYGKIIERIQNHAPNAKIIMVTTAYTDSVHEQFNDAIVNIAEHYGLPVIRQLDDEFLASDTYWNTMYYNHPVAATYGGMANAFERLFSKCTYKYREYFKDYYVPKNYPLD